MLVRGRLDTGKRSFRITSVYMRGDAVFLGDSKSRTLIYSLKSGEQKGKLIGRVVTASASGDRVLMENDDGVADLYDTGTLEPVAHFAFPCRIAGADFLADGNLMILTADQNVYQLDTSRTQKTSPPQAL